MRAPTAEFPTPDCRRDQVLATASLLFAPVEPARNGTNSLHCYVQTLRSPPPHTAFPLVLWQIGTLQRLLHQSLYVHAPRKARHCRKGTARRMQSPSPAALGRRSPWVLLICHPLQRKAQTLATAVRRCEDSLSEQSLCESLALACLQHRGQRAYSVAASFATYSLLHGSTTNLPGGLRS